MTMTHPLRALRLLLGTLLLTAGFGLTAPAHAFESLSCVAYVQQASAVRLHGNGHQWWDNAAGAYSRGSRPAPGAVMVFARTSHLPFGHVAIVRSVRNSRSILVDHANWSPINGRRGQVERAVSVVDVSAANDWSKVRVWYDPTEDLGTTSYGIRGFVYAPGHLPQDGHKGDKPSGRPVHHDQKDLKATRTAAQSDKTADKKADKSSSKAAQTGAASHRTVTRTEPAAKPAARIVKVSVPAPPPQKPQHIHR